MGVRRPLLLRRKNEPAVSMIWTLETTEVSDRSTVDTPSVAMLPCPAERVPKRCVCQTSSSFRMSESCQSQTGGTKTWLTALVLLNPSADSKLNRMSPSPTGWRSQKPSRLIELSLSANTRLLTAPSSKDSQEGLNWP